jgi:hypothetical protein
MSTRVLTTLFLAFVAVGCAAADPEVEDAEAAASASDDAAPEVDTDTTNTEATGSNCACPAGQEYQNGLCYPACASGWSGEGPVCWQRCASGFTDTGWFCQRNSKVISANTSSCPWYNKCGVGSDCNKCPAGYANDGCTCRIDAYIYAQPSYGRGAGTVPSCTTY